MLLLPTRLVRGMASGLKLSSAARTSRQDREQSAPAASLDGLRWAPTAASRVSAPLDERLRSQAPEAFLGAPGEAPRKGSGGPSQRHPVLSESNAECAWGVSKGEGTGAKTTGRGSANRAPFSPTVSRGCKHRPPMRLSPLPHSSCRAPKAPRLVLACSTGIAAACHRVPVLWIALRQVRGCMRLGAGVFPGLFGPRRM
jgi:hypothetical protein